MASIERADLWARTRAAGGGNATAVELISRADLKESTMVSSNQKPESATEKAPPFAGTVAGRVGVPAVPNKDNEAPSPGAEADKSQAEEEE